MPPGAKKRRAAKKKKGGANNPNSNNNAPSITNGNDSNNYTSHEHDKDSDGGEVEVETNSPTSEDHHDDAFNDTGKEVDKSEPLSVGSLDTQSKLMEGISEVGFEENGANKAVEIVEEGKSVETENKSMDGVPSDFEETKKVEPEGNGEIKKVEPEGNGAIEILGGACQKELVDIACIEPVISLDVDNEKSSGVTADFKPETVEKKLEEPGDVINRTARLNNSEEHVDLLPQEPIAAVDGAPSSENFVADLGEPETSVSEKVIHMVESTPAEDTSACGSDLKENGRELPPSTHEVSQVSSSELDSSSKKIKEKVVPTMDETDGNGQGELAVGKVDKLQPYEGSTTQASEKTKDMGAVESTEQQPSISLAPRVAQRTSWMSCCGLFDMIMGSR